MRLPPLKQFHRLPHFVQQFLEYREQAKNTGARVPAWRDWRPILSDATKATSFDSHYIYHCAWAARQLALNNPSRHVDFSSALWFVSIASSICPIEHYDYRPPDLHLSNVKVGSCDLMNLPFADESLSSISCMHVIEHVGLGRYGDTLDAIGDLKAMAELERVLAPGGVLLFATPVGRARTVFNAHRIYSYEDILKSFPSLTVESFSLITDKRHGGRLVENADPDLVAAQKYACGCWVFRRPV